MDLIQTIDRLVKITLCADWDTEMDPNKRRELIVKMNDLAKRKEETQREEEQTLILKSLRNATEEISLDVESCLKMAQIRKLVGVHAVIEKFKFPVHELCRMWKKVTGEERYYAAVYQTPFVWMLKRGDEFLPEAHIKGKAVIACRQADPDQYIFYIIPANDSDLFDHITYR
jgi:hypothetical protein